MGNSAQKLKDDALAAETAAAKETAGQLDLLMAMGKGKLDSFFKDVELDKNPHFYKIDKILEKVERVQVTTSQDASKLKEAAGAIVDNISKGQIGDMIKTTIGVGIDALFASSSGSASEEKTYAVKLSGLALYRIDIYMYKYELKTSGLLASDSSMFVYGYSTSTIGEEITPSNLRGMVGLLPFSDAQGQPIQGPLELIAAQKTLYDALADIFIETGDEPGLLKSALPPNDASMAVSSAIAPLTDEAKKAARLAKSRALTGGI